MGKRKPEKKYDLMVEDIQKCRWRTQRGDEDGLIIYLINIFLKTINVQHKILSFSNWYRICSLHFKNYWRIIKHSCH